MFRKIQRVIFGRAPNFMLICTEVWKICSFGELSDRGNLDKQGLTVVSRKEVGNQKKDCVMILLNKEIDQKERLYATDSTCS